MKKWMAILAAVVMSLSLAFAEEIPFEELLPEETAEPTSTITPEETLQPEETQEPPYAVIPEETENPEETVIPEETENPEYAEDLQISNGMVAYLHEYIIPFVFDPSYSGQTDGIVQADFYYESDDVLYDLFILIPPDVQTGDVLSPANASAWNTEDVSVILRTLTVNGENYAYASVYEGYGYPY